MNVQALALVLGQDNNLLVAAIDQIGKRKVDQPVVAAKGHRRLRPLIGKRGKSASLPAGKDHGQGFGTGTKIHWGDFLGGTDSSGFWPEAPMDKG